MIARIQRRLKMDFGGVKLNLLTLKVNDPAMQTAILEYRGELAGSLFWPIAITCTISSLTHVFNTFVLKTGHPFLLVTSAGVMIVVLLFALCKYLKKLQLIFYLAQLYFYVHAICVSLVYLDVLPEVLQGSLETFEF